MPKYYGTPANLFQIGATTKLSITSTSQNVQLDKDAIYRIFTDTLCYLAQGSDNTVTATTGDMPLDGFSEFFINTYDNQNWLAFIGTSGNLYVTKVS